MILKKLFSIIACLLLALPILADDDIMITRDGEMKKVKIERISTSQVTFIDLKQKKRGSQDVSTTFVYMILREKGKNIFFDEEGIQMTSPAVKFDKKDDVVLLNKGEIIVVYNLSTSKDELKYQLQDKKKAPWVNTPKSEVFMVMNSDGTTTLYYETNKQNQNTAPQVSIGAKTASGAPATQRAVSAPAASGKRYKIGDYYNSNGLRGIVVRVDQSGEHGLIMSMERTSKRWVKGTKTNLSTNAFHEDDGEYNMEELQKYLDETGNTWDHFPLFEWARSLGDGWYIPALDELKDILLAINGGLGKYNAQIMKPIRKMIKENNGDNLIDGGFYNSSFPCAMFSSTEGDEGKVMTLRFKPNGLSMLSRWGTPHGQFIIDNMPKQAVETGLYKIKYGSRAVHKF